MTSNSAPGADFLPPPAQAHYSYLVAQGSLKPGAQALYTDLRLASFWQHVGTALSGCRQEAYEYLAGSLLVPLKLYGSIGTTDRPSSKVAIRERQRAADKLLDKASAQALELSRLLHQLEETTTFLPDELRLVHLFTATTDLPLEDASSYFEGIRTAQALERLATALDAHPRAEGLFAEVAGMASQKATWRDWLREAHQNLEPFNRMYGARLELKETHYVALVQSLVDSKVSRSAVNHALRAMRDSS